MALRYISSLKPQNVHANQSGRPGNTMKMFDCCVWTQGQEDLKGISEAVSRYEIIINDASKASACTGNFASNASSVP